MPIYRLWRERDNATFECDAQNPEQAVSTFSRKLGVALTLDEGLAAPHYMMALVPTDIHWGNKFDIPVYEARPRSK